MSRSTCATHLDNFGSALLITSECAPADTILLHQSQLELRPHNLRLAFGGVNVPEQW